MTLYKQILTGVSMLFLVLLIGLHAVYVTNARHYLEQQLASHAQDAATSIAMSLGSRGAVSNAALVETVIGPAFDRGYFRKISVVSVSGAPIAARELPIAYGNVPPWFVRLFPIEALDSEAIITAGWNQLGRVIVVSQPHFVYQQLWHTAVGTLAYFAVAYVLTLVATRLFLRNLLRPLRVIEDMAEAIGRRDFRTTDICPRAPELRRVVAAINSLSGKVRGVIADEAERAERLCKEAREDALTGLYTRAAFEQEYESLVAGQDIYAVTLALLEVTDIRRVNQTEGRARGDEILACTASALRAGCAAIPAIRGRLAGTHFAIAVVNVGAAAAQRILDGIATRVAACLATEFPGLGVDVHCGGAYSENGAPALAALLASADLGLERARSHGSATCELVRLGDAPQPPLGSLEWRRIISAAIAGDRYTLYAQPVMGLPAHEVLHREVFVRQIDEAGHALPAAVFLPMAARHGLLPRIDAGVAEKVFRHLEKHPAGADRIALNISAQTLGDLPVVERLLQLVRGNRAIAARLVFEMTEFGAARDPRATQEFASKVRALGAGFALDNFALHRSGLALLPIVLPEYVKLSPQFTAEFLHRKDMQFLVTSLARIAKPLEIRLIAQAVESEGALAQLMELSIGGYQGYVSGMPAPLC